MPLLLIVLLAASDGSDLRRVELDSDPLQSLQWHLLNDGSLTEVWPRIEAGADINVTPAWELTEGDPGVVIAVLDTGFPIDHPDLPAQQRVPGWDFVDGDPDPAPPGFASLDSHGLAVAALALAPRNDVGVVGVCPRCTLAPLRVLATSSLARDGDLIAALRWAAANADIILASWSYDAFAFVSDDVFDAIRWAARNGRGGRGAVVVFSAGNRASDILDYTPQMMHETLSVGATDERDLRASYSNTGPGLSLVAPGGVTDQIGIDERVARAKLITADLAGDAGNNPTRDDVRSPGIVDDLAATASFSGTSASAPLVAGAAGLLLSAFPDLTANEVNWILTASASPVAGGAYDSRGFSALYGHGRLDVGAALLMAAAGEHCIQRLEACGNGLDDDCDRRVDDEDSDCGGQGVRAFEVEVGRVCTNADVCGDGYCDAFDNFCTAVCDFDCPSGANCVGRAGEGRCQLGCDPSVADSCPDDWVCAVPELGLVPPGQPHQPTCVPSCVSDGDCANARCLEGACAGADLVEDPEPPVGCSAGTSGAWWLVSVFYATRRRRRR